MDQQLPAGAHRDYREANGPRKVRTGKIIAGGPQGQAIRTFEEAKIVRDNLTRELPWNEYSVTGVQGDYRILEYAGDCFPTPYSKIK